MSYMSFPLYKCAVCGREELGIEFVTVLHQTAYLPEGWSGSRKIGEACYCDKCTEEIRKVRDGR